MNMEKQIIKRIEVARLVALHKLGVLPEDEERRLAAWAAQSEENRQLYEKLLHAETSRNNGMPTTEKAWQDFTRRYRVRPKRYATWRRVSYTAVACCAAVLLTTGILHFYSRDKADEIMTPRPLNSVQLVLENGNTITLDREEHAAIKQTASIPLEMNQKEIDYTTVEQESLQEIPVYHKIIVPKYGEYTVKLADNTVVKLNSESTLKYPVAFNGDTREVWLSGEAYLEVTRDTSKQFIVHAAGTEIAVLGTTFNVNAYDSEKEVATTLVNGKVEVSNEVTTQVISPGQQAITSRDNPRIEVKEVDTRVVTAWVRDMFYFDEEPLASIMETLARWYEFRVVFENENAKQRRFTLEVSRYADIDKVLNFIEETRVVKCRKEGNTIYIK